MGRRTQILGRFKELLSPSGRNSPSSGSSRHRSPLVPSQSHVSHVSGGSNTPVASAPASLHQQNQAKRDPALAEAIRKYAAGLTDQEKVDFDEQSTKSPLELINKVKALDESHKKSSVSRCLAPRIEKVLNTIDRFMGALYTCIQHSPEYSSLVVGGFKCILQLSLGFFGFFQRLSDTMEHIEDHLSYLCKYAEPMFQKSVSVQEALVNVYCDLLEFCTQTRRIFTSGGEQSRSASFKVFQRLPWDPYETRLRDIQMRFSGHADVVFKAAQVQGMIDENTERQWLRLRTAMEDLKHRDEKRRKVLEWLPAIDFEETHQKNFSKRFGSTGQWLLDDDNYQTWSNEDESRLLWCHGAPGTGKTVLSSLVTQTLLEQLNSSEDIGIAYAYCSYTESHDPATFIAAFIKQLSRKKEYLPEKLEELFDTYHRDARKPGFSELQQLFLDISEEFSQVFVVLDALDEFSLEQRQELLPFLQKIVTCGGTVKLFVASRKEEDINRAFVDVMAIQIQAAKVSKDIKSYVEFELDRRLHDGCLRFKDPGLKKEVLDALLNKAEGMFLWVGFQLDHICDQYSDNEIRKALQSLPENLEQVYERILAEIDRNKAKSALARKVLFWLAYAKQPLAPKQLAEAVAITPGVASLVDLNQYMVNDLEMLVNSCNNLVQVVFTDGDGEWGRSSSPIVKLVHYSVKEFLLRVPGPGNSSIPNRYLPEPQAAHDEIARYCLTYILLVPTRDAFSEKDCSFIIYAIECWKQHVQALTYITDDLWELVYQFIHTENVLDEIRIYGDIQEGQYRFNRSDLILPPPLNVALLELPLVSARFKKENTNTEKFFNTDATTIHSVVVAGSFEAVKLLHSWGCDISALDRSGNTPLMYARSYDIAKFLLDKGVDVNAQGGRYGNALQAAACNESREVVKLLLERGADVNAQGGLYENALQAAISSGRREVVELLLEQGADVNFQGGGYGNALQAAASNGRREVVELLLEQGPDVNAQGGRYGNALQAAASNGNREVVELLLRWGADVNAQGGRYGNALQAAASNGRREVVELLSEWGAHVNAQGGHYGNALQAAACNGNREVVELLLEQVADVNAQGGKYGNALQAAVSSGHWEVAELLLERGADYNAQGGEYGNALQAAALSGCREMVELLLERGADVNAQGGHYGNALQAGASSECSEVVELLLGWGADVNAHGGEYGNALQAAASSGSREVVELLLEQGADVNAQGSIYGNALQAAVSSGCREVVELLLERGADVNDQGGVYGNSLGATTSDGIVQLLKTQGAIESNPLDFQ